MNRSSSILVIRSSLLCTSYKILTFLCSYLLLCIMKTLLANSNWHINIYRTTKFSTNHIYWDAHISVSYVYHNNILVTSFDLPTQWGRNNSKIILLIHTKKILHCIFFWYYWIAKEVGSLVFISQQLINLIEHSQFLTD